MVDHRIQVLCIWKQYACVEYRGLLLWNQMVVTNGLLIKAITIGKIRIWKQYACVEYHMNVLNTEVYCYEIKWLLQMVYG